MGCYGRDVGTIRETNSLNFCNIKFVKLLNNLVVACMVANIFQTPMVGLMDCPTSFPYISYEVKNSLELQAIVDIIVKS